MPTSDKVICCFWGFEKVLTNTLEFCLQVLVGENRISVQSYKDFSFEDIQSIKHCNGPIFFLAASSTREQERQATELLMHLRSQNGQISLTPFIFCSAASHLSNKVSPVINSPGCYSCQLPDIFTSLFPILSVGSISAEEKEQFLVQHGRKLLSQRMAEIVRDSFFHSFPSKDLRSFWYYVKKKERSLLGEGLQAGKEAFIKSRDKCLDDLAPFWDKLGLAKQTAYPEFTQIQIILEELETKLQTTVETDQAFWDAINEKLTQIESLKQNALGRKYWPLEKGNE